MLDQTDRIDFLQHAVETMAEQMLQLKGELAALRAEVEASEQRQLHLMASTDQMEAMQVSLSALEHQLLAFRKPRQKPRPMVKGAMHRRQALIILSAMFLLSGLALAFRALLTWTPEVGPG